MATVDYKDALEKATALTEDEQKRLIAELEGRIAVKSASERSILELCGLGEAIWDGMDAQQYVKNERASWNG